MEQDQTPRSDIQPVLRTCENCVTAKVKCTRSNNSSGCGRCHRLGKTCTFRQALRRNNETRKDKRISALEAKVDQLLSSSGSAIIEQDSPESQDIRQNSLLAAVSSTEKRSRSVSSSHAISTRDVISAGLLSVELATSFIVDFRNTFAPQFPFVAISSRATTEQLRGEKPFLFLAILTISSYKDPPLQRKLCEELKHAVSNRMIFHSEGSFEMLQGLLIYLAWYHYYPKPPHYSQFLQLAISIVIDLNLDRVPQPMSWKTPLTKMPQTILKSSLAPQSAKTNEKSRALAGCYYLSSTVSVILQKMETFPHSVYIERCCMLLGEAEENSTDRFLLYIIQLQHIMDKINHLFLNIGGELNMSNPAVAALVMSFKSDLEVFKERLPFALTESRILLFQFYTTELALFQVSLVNERPRLSRPEPTTPASSRLDILRAGLLSAKCLLDFFLSLPTGTEIGFNNSEWIQMGFAFIVAAKLSVAAAEISLARETASLRTSLDMSGILKQSVERISALRALRPTPPGERDVFLDFEQRIKGIQRWFENQAWPESTGTRQRADLAGVPAQDNGLPEMLHPDGMLSGFDTNDFTGGLPYSTRMFDMDLAQFFPELDPGANYGDMMQFSFDQ